MGRIHAPARDHTADVLHGGPVAAQQVYPSKRVRLIVPFPPGGANDIVARLIGQRLNDRWARVVVIDNRAGAGGNYTRGVCASHRRRDRALEQSDP